MGAFTYTKLGGDNGFKYRFGYQISQLPTKGYIAYEYNPLLNYRLNRNRDSNNLHPGEAKLVSFLQETLLRQGANADGDIIFTTILGKEFKIAKDEEGHSITTNDLEEHFYHYQKIYIQNPLGSDSEWIPGPELYVYNPNDDSLLEAGSIVDLDTDQLNFSLNNPVEIDVQPSYDGSVNLILNDDRNMPRMINSRFSSTGLNTYEIPKRYGDTDSNLYDEDEFDLDTTLLKRYNTLPLIKYNGLVYYGSLPVGNYTIYLKYADSDGNETDFIAESGVISVFKGIDKSPTSIDGGFSDMNSGKGISITVSNIDYNYDHMVVYYSRTMAAEGGERLTLAYKVTNMFDILNKTCEIILDGSEQKLGIPVETLNASYMMILSAKSQAQNLSRLFLANLTLSKLPYEDLKDVSLRILPFLNPVDKWDLIGHVQVNYGDPTGKFEYYNSKNIYNYVGYWDESIYRFGIVYILENNELSPVFNLRGCAKLPEFGNLSDAYNLKLLEDTSFMEDGKRRYLEIDEDSHELVEGTRALENADGVFRIDYDYKDKEGKDDSSEKIFGIGVYIDDMILSYLKNILKIKGFFIVRLRRIPTILAQSFTIGRDPESKVPIVSTKKGNHIKYYGECFLSNKTKVVNDYPSRLYEFTDPDTITNSEDVVGICPEFEVNQSYYNNIFTGASLPIRETKLLYKGIDKYNTRFYGNTSGNYILSKDRGYKKVDIASVTDSSLAAVLENSAFKASIGNAADVRVFKYYEVKNKLKSNAWNLVRGIYSPFLAIHARETDNKILPNKLINIYIPEYSEDKIPEYFKIRYRDSSEYYPVSNRIDLTSSEELIPTTILEGLSGSNLFIYRGDCYTCTFTHRLNRNFQDSGGPTNDIIIDEDTWKAYNYKKPESIEKVNRGDINAVQLGSWYTIQIASSLNLSIRSSDASHSAEVALMGQERSFYPLRQATVEGSCKIPDALGINKGFGSTTGLKLYKHIESIFINNEFLNRIAFSNVYNNSYQNGYRVFMSTNYRDYNKEYGQITKILPMRNNLLCIFEHGIALIAINERVTVGDGDGGPVMLNSDTVLSPTLTPISDSYGSLWEDSIITTNNGAVVYGVDTVAKKIWRYNGQFQTISDFKINKFLIDNISLSEREHLTIVGLRNVKAHYNANKADVMFTFYDNTYGFEEKVWNICYNEYMESFTTFYSWVPSYSENIDNMYFSYDRNSAKNIAKLATSQLNSTSSDGIVVTNVLLKNDSNDIAYTMIPADDKIAIVNRALPNIDSNYVVIYELVNDSFNNYRNFALVPVLADNNGERESSILELDADKSKFKLLKYWKLKFTPKEGGSADVDAVTLYLIDLSKSRFDSTESDIKLPDRPVVLLNILATVIILSNKAGYLEYLSNFSKFAESNYAQYLSTIALTTEEILNNPLLTEDDYKLPSLTTDLWKHGRAGIIDTKETILPTHWYGKFHPFEFLFLVSLGSQAQKVYQNLVLLSNSAEPESFHFEITGDCYDFSKDKANMYYRQEATKLLYQDNGSDILYNHNYTNVNPERNKKSTVFPLYYNKIDDYDNIYDAYQEMKSDSRDYQNLSGTEVYWDEDLDSFKLITHIKNSPINGHWKRVSKEVYEAVKENEDSAGKTKILNTCYYIWEDVGRLRGNSHYKEDKWSILIPSITLLLKNESDKDWAPGINSKNVPPIVLTFIPNDITKLEITAEDLPNTYDMGLIIPGTKWTNRKETRIRDNYLKVRIRYSGEQLALIHAIYTMYEDSFA